MLGQKKNHHLRCDYCYYFKVGYFSVLACLEVFYLFIYLFWLLLRENAVRLKSIDNWIMIVSVWKWLSRTLRCYSNAHSPASESRSVARVTHSGLFNTFGQVCLVSDPSVLAPPMPTFYFQTKPSCVRRGRWNACSRPCSAAEWHETLRCVQRALLLTCHTQDVYSVRE